LVVPQRDVGVQERLGAVPAGDVLGGGLRGEWRRGEGEDRRTAQDVHQQLQSDRGR